MSTRPVSVSSSGLIVTQTTDLHGRNITRAPQASASASVSRIYAGGYEAHDLP